MPEEETFEEVENLEGASEEGQITRVRLPKNREVIGVVIGKMGGRHFKVFCSDGNERLCRIPGSKKRGMWIDLDSFVIVKIWEVQGDTRGDIIWKYRKAQVKWLENKGYLDNMKEFL